MGIIQLISVYSLEALEEMYFRKVSLHDWFGKWYCKLLNYSLADVHPKVQEESFIIEI